MVSFLWPRLRVRCWVSPWPSLGEKVLDCFSHHEDRVSDTLLLSMVWLAELIWRWLRLMRLLMLSMT